MKGVYDATRKLCSEPPKKIDMVRNSSGKLLTQEEEVRKRWKEHFAILNRHNPEQVADMISDMGVIEELPSGPIAKSEIHLHTAYPERFFMFFFSNKFSSAFSSFASVSSRPLLHSISSAH